MLVSSECVKEGAGSSLGWLSPDVCLQCWVPVLVMGFLLGNSSDDGDVDDDGDGDGDDDRDDGDGDNDDDIMVVMMVVVVMVMMMLVMMGMMVMMVVVSTNYNTMLGVCSSFNLSTGLPRNHL